jgi:hypothetical protein
MSRSTGQFDVFYLQCYSDSRNKHSWNDFICECWLRNEYLLEGQTFFGSVHRHKLLNLVICHRWKRYSSAHYFYPQRKKGALGLWERNRDQRNNELIDKMGIFSCLCLADFWAYFPLFCLDEFVCTSWFECFGCRGLSLGFGGLFRFSEVRWQLSPIGSRR